MQIETVSVRFKNGLHAYSFSPNGIDLKVGDFVVVETERGSDLGVVVKVKDMIDPVTLTSPLRNVLYKASKELVQKSKKFDEDSKQYFPLVKQIVKESGLDMKVVQIESSYDNNRYIISFSADARVDFRELVKKLAEKLKKRVELRQIGPRDEVRLLGGFGPCGKICCCVQSFGEFDHVSMKMAKTQNLTLNPNSISGLCGKLMCCLAYENPAYAQAQKMLPKIGEEVSTADGKGVVVFNNLLKLEVDVKFSKGDDSEVKTYPVSEVKFKKEHNERKD